jgi:hypothetical protein
MMLLLEWVFGGDLEGEVAAMVVVMTCSWCCVAVRGRCCGERLRMAGNSRPQLISKD